MDAARSDLNLLREALTTIHPGLNRRTDPTRIAQAFEELSTDLTLGSPGQAISETHLYRGVSALLALIRCSHTKAEPPAAVEQWRRMHATHLPFRFRLIQDRMVVVSCADAAVGRGAEVLAINGRSVAATLAAVEPMIAADGHTPWSRAATLADDGDLMGSGLDEFYPHVFGWAEAFDILYRTDDRAPIQSIRLPPLRFDDWLQLDNLGKPWRANFGEATQWGMLSADTGLLRVPTFVNYRRPVDAKALFSRAMQALSERGARRLLLDLRDNGGGSDDAALALLDHLALQPYTYQRAVRLKNIRYGDLPRHIESWGDRQALFEPPEADFIRSPDGWYDRRPERQPAVLMPRQPAAAAFQGSVTVLTSPVNASGATMLISKLRDMDRVELIGGPCGGSADGATAGRIFNLKLPASGITVRIPVAFNQMNVDRFEPSGGLQPDRWVEATVEDFRAGRDQVMEAALVRPFHRGRHGHRDARCRAHRAAAAIALPESG